MPNHKNGFLSSLIEKKILHFCIAKSNDFCYTIIRNEGRILIAKKERMSLWFVMLIISIWFASSFCLMVLEYLFCLWVTSVSIIVITHLLRFPVPISCVLILFVNSFAFILSVISISEWVL